MRSLLGEVIGWAVTWLPWMGLALGAMFIVAGVMAMDDDDGAGRDFLLLSIAVLLLTGVFVGLIMAQ